MEFKKVNEEIEILTLLEKNDSLTVYGSDLIVKLKTLLQQRTEMLKSLIKMCEFHEKNASYDKGDNGYYKAKQLIKKATEL